MKRILVFAFLLGSLGASATQITWTGASGANWNTGTNWSTGTVPTSTDEAIFNTSGALVTLDFTTSTTIGKLTISNNVTFQTALVRTINVGSASFTAGSNVFTVASGKLLTLQSTTNSVGITIAVVTGYKGSIDGTVNLGAGASTAQKHFLTSPDVSGISFQNHSVCNTTSVSSGSAFGTTGTAGSVAFLLGSTFNFLGGTTPFGTAGANIVSFKAGSTYSHQYSVAPTGLGVTYANFEYNYNGSETITNNSSCTINNLTIKQGSLTFGALTSGSSPASTFNILNDITINSGATLAIGSVTGTNTNPNGIIFNFAGTSQSFTNNGTFNVSCNMSNGNGITNANGTGYKTQINVGSAGNPCVLTLNSNFDMATSPVASSTNNPFNRNLTIATGSTLSIANGITLSIAGTLVNNGTINGAGTLNLNGNAATLPAAQSIASTVNVANLTTNNTAGVTISGGTTSITGKLLVSSGTLTTGGLLTLKSTSITNSAVVDQVGGSISGNVTVERFIPQGLRTFRDLGFGVYTNTGTIFSNWQEGGVNNNGYGIAITGAKGVSSGFDNTTGFDYSLTGNGSIYQYTANAWSAVTSTKVTLDPYKGYRVLVRGNRTVDLFPANSDLQPANMISDATLRTTGKLITGDVTYSVGGVTNAVANSTYGLTSSAGSYSLVTNPYIAPVDWEAVWNGGATNLNSNYWYNDPTGTTTGKSSGYTKFVSYDASLHTTNNPLGTSNVGRYLQPGQAFFVENATSSATLLFKESYKVASQTKTAIFGATAPINRVAIALYKAGENLDGAVTVFGNYPKEAGVEDAVKFSNSDENIAFTVGTTDLAINGYSLPTSTDVLPIHMYQLKANTSYSLRLDVSQFAGNGVTVYVRDNVSNTTTPLTGNNTTVSFTTAATDAASYGTRYSIVFAPAALPVSSIVTSAIAKGGNVIVSWNTVGEKNVAVYTVERSVNGVEFSGIATKSATNTTKATYTITDAAAQNGTNYYRIKATDKSGNTSYSAVVAVAITSGNKAISIYPNPVTGSSFGLKLANFTEGKYAVSVYNNLGQKVLATTVAHAAGNTTEQVSLSHHLAAGTYSVSVAGATGAAYQTQLIIK